MREMRLLALSGRISAASRGNVRKPAEFYTNPAEIPAAMKISASLACYRRKAAAFKLRGLTARGTRRLRRPNATTRQERIYMRRERGLKAWEKLSTRLRLAGLTTRGGRPVAFYRARRTEALILESEIDAAAKSVARNFHKFDRETQAACLVLAEHLAAIKQRISGMSRD